MIEAGMKKFEATVEPDETVNELRQQRNDLKEELDHARDRIEKLEAQLHTSEQEKIKQTIENNPGVTIGEIGQELANTVPERLDGHLDVLQGTEVTIDGQRCYPVEETA
jgi:predicted RNase H-like nuclease (RuvC/YqgF family)